MKTTTTNSKNLINRYISLLFIMLTAVLIIPNVSFSQFQGKIVSNAVNNQINPIMTTDGSGGSIITWQDKRNGKYEIFAQRMNAEGNAMWTLNGIAICTQDSNYNPIIVSDGSGGAIIAWQSLRGSYHC